MKLLLLGGTSDAIKLCKQLLRSHNIIYSIKGLIRLPKLDCEIHSGGFGGVQGLVNFIQQKHIECVIDATHPYAVTISQHSILAAHYTKIPCFHYLRPAWQQQPNDHWIILKNTKQLIEAINNTSLHLSRFFFTIGQLPPEIIKAKNTSHFYLIRSAIGQKEYKIDSQSLWIKSIGPFSIEKEQQLFNQYQINALVTKNSGGKSVAAKIQIARKNNIPVFMLQRPNFQSPYPIFNNINKLASNLKQDTLH